MFENMLSLIPVQGYLNAESSTLKFCAQCQVFCQSFVNAICLWQTFGAEANFVHGLAAGGRSALIESLQISGGKSPLENTVLQK